MNTHRWILLALCIVGALAVVLAIKPYPVGGFQDDGAYVVLAKALATGEGYRILNLPNAPTATHFPPLYPLFLAGLWKVDPAFPHNVVIFKFANALLLGVAAALAFWFAQTQLMMRRWTAALTAAATTLALPLVWMASMVLSEPLFLAALFPVLALCERTLISAVSRRRLLLVGLAGGALGLVRTLGAFVVPVTVIVLAARRRWVDAALVLLGGAIVLGPWQVWSLAHQGELPAVLSGKYGSYFGWVVEGARAGGITFVTDVARINVSFSAGFLAATFAAGALPLALRLVVSIAAMSLLLLGGRELGRRAPITALFLATYVTVVLLWPFPPDRFFWAVWPLLGFAFVLGAHRMRQMFAPASMPRWRSAAFAAAACLVVAAYAAPHVLATPRFWIGEMEDIANRSRAIVAWAAAHTRPNDIIATDDDGLVYLYTGRRTVPVGTFTPPDYVEPQTQAMAATALRTILREYPARWVLPSTGLGIQASVANTTVAPPLLALRGSLPVGAVFERVDSPQQARP